jgi:hypothetical protein
LQLLNTQKNVRCGWLVEVTELAALVSLLKPLLDSKNLNQAIIDNQTRWGHMRLPEHSAFLPSTNLLDPLLHKWSGTCVNQS